jgi:MYXO-CTERM domain-containing protein
VDASGNVYVADTTNNLLRKITPDGTVSTLAGVVGVAGSSDGTGSAALFNMPGGLAVDASGNIYLADTGNSTIRKITPAGVVTTIAGLPGVAGFKDGTGSDAWFNQPKALTVDATGNVFVADTGNATVRQITPAGVVTTPYLTQAAVSTTSTTTTSTTTTTTAAGTGTISPANGSTVGTAPASSSSGGGAPSTWFLGALGLLGALRRFYSKRR